MSQVLYHPCADCPFRSDVPGYLYRSRVWEIIRGIDRGEFHCHKTTVPCEDEDGGGGRETNDGSKLCAGSLLFQYEVTRPGQMTRIGERLGFIHPAKLRGKDLIHQSEDEMADHHGSATDT